MIKKKKILLVEDEKMLVDMYEYKFSEAGFDVSLASNVKQGLEIARKEKPDLIILDIILPKNNGVYFLKKLRMDKSISSILVVILSNYDDPIVKKQVKKLGVEDYLLKTDFTPLMLTKKIESYLFN